ncbi:MAG: MATE family efflux transporter [Erysipelotrichaceae bacterium]
MTSINLAQKLNSSEQMNLSEKVQTVFILSLPGVLAQIGEIIMEYIDAAMVGSLGPAASASIGLVSSSTWLFGGIASGCASGFAVQVAHAIGAQDRERARKIAKQSLMASLIFSLLMTSAGVFISFRLPLWLKADESLWHDATMYFLFFSLFMIPRLLSRLCISLLQCTGNMKLPSILSVIMCFLDVVFNFFLILPSRYVLGIYVPGFGLGVLGAQLGTSFAYLVISLLLFYFAFIKEDSISLIDNEASWFCEGKIIHEAVNIGLPIAMEQSAVTLAQVVGSRIVAPLGTIAIAANSFAVTAESICYMPGFGISAAATTMVGQALGADRKDYAFSFGWLTTIMGMIVMALMGMLMYFICPFVFGFMTPDLEVQKLAVDVLRIELFAEPLFAASIVATGALRGAKDTFIPGLINLLSIWGVRITLSLFLVNRIGLYGIWLAMAIELSIRGLLMLIRLYSCKQLKK